jgi:hypothetical protein
MRTAGTLIAAVVLALSGAAEAGAVTRIGADPDLFPAFSAKVHDYVSRCHAGHRLLLAIHAPPSARVTAGARKPHRGGMRTKFHLKAGEAVRVLIATKHRRAAYHVRCLPKDFPQWTAERHGTPQASFYIVTPAEGGPHGSPYVVIFDAHGAPVWWMRRSYRPIDAKLLPDGNLAWSIFTDATFGTTPVPYEERRLDGSFVRRIETVGVNTDSHDLQVMPNGDYLLVSYVLRATTVDLSQYGGPADARVYDAEVQEVSPRGKLVWSWNSKDHTAVSESTPFMGAVITRPQALPDGGMAYDIAHVNSVELDGDSVLISLRHLDAIFKVNRTTGAIDWKLGGTRTSDSLRVVGQPEDSVVFGGQHDVRLLPDGTITMHDNRTGQKDVGPRALRYRIDEAARTATQLEEITDPDTIASLCCGSARRLAGGDWVMSWGYNSLVRELSPKGKVVFGLRFGGGLFSYRAVPLAPGELSRRALRAGMDAQVKR